MEKYVALGWLFLASGYFGHALIRLLGEVQYAKRNLINEKAYFEQMRLLVTSSRKERAVRLSEAVLTPVTLAAKELLLLGEARCPEFEHQRVSLSHTVYRVLLPTLVAMVVCAAFPVSVLFMPVMMIGSVIAGLSLVVQTAVHEHVQCNVRSFKDFYQWFKKQDPCITGFNCPTCPTCEA